MSNPFEALNISDDQDQQQFVKTTTDKVRKTHKQRRQLKKQNPTNTTQTPVNPEIPLIRAKETGYEHKHKRQTGRPIKGIPSGHTLDRRSGTGRDDRPRKQGGGFGNVGNVKDELHKQKYEKPTTEQLAPQSTEELPAHEQTKPEEPQPLTLAEYYQSKGINLNTTAQKKVPVKGEVNAEWLKKQKLTLLETKEDKKRQQTLKQNVLQHNNTKVETGLGNSELLGFGSRPAQKPREQESGNDNRHPKGKKGPKVNLKEDDFPTL